MMDEPDFRLPEGTALALIDAATELFGQKGFAGTSTRELAAKAGVNIASIAYHFGSKNGLRRACAQCFSTRIARQIGVLPEPESLTPEAAEAVLRQVILRMVDFMIGSPEARNTIYFVIREISENSETIDIMYENVVMPMHGRICRLVGLATGLPPDTARLKLSVFGFIGQILYFRIGGPIVSRRMGWPDIGPHEIAQITEVLLAQLEAALDTLRRSRS